LRRADLFSSGPGRDTPSRGCPDGEELGGVSPPPPVEYSSLKRGRSLPRRQTGRRCARCGRRLGDGGWTVVGVGRLCRDCVRKVSPGWTIRRIGQEVCPKRDKEG